MNFPMFADDCTVRTNDEDGVVQFVYFTLWTAKKDRPFQAFHEPAKLLHPCVWLRPDPVGADHLSKLQSGYGELWSDDPLCPDSSSVFDGFNDHLFVAIDIAWNHREMEKRNFPWFHFQSAP